MRSSNGRVLALIFCIIAATAASAEARMRIETGRDLHAACTVLAENALNPQKPTPAKARYCRQYIAGYFESLRHIRQNGKSDSVFGPGSRDPYACLNLDGPRSYDQLAAQIVRTGDWNPPLLDGEAIALIHKTFSDNPPC